MSVLKNALTIHDKNSADIDRLYNYYRGNQPIINRTKTVRPEINNKIVENHALEIVDFKKGYVFGEPIQYVRRGKEESISEQLDKLNSFMLLENKASEDQELAEWHYIAGTAYRITLVNKKYGEDESPFIIDTLDPRYTFVVYSNGIGSKPLMGVKYIVADDDKIIYSVYTDSFYYEIVDDKITKGNSMPHTLGYVPIIEYPTGKSRLGAFEIVIGLLDALNNAASNRLDAIEQFVQAFFKFVNCDIDEEKFTALKELGAIKIKSTDSMKADVDIIARELNQGQVQISKDDLYQMVLIICGMPDRQGSSKTTGDTGQAVLLRDGWSAAESRARATELAFIPSEKQFIKIALRIAKELVKDFHLSLAQIDIKFTRNRTDNIQTKTQSMESMLKSGLHPRIAIATSGLFSDPESVYLESLEYLKKWIEGKADYIPSNDKAAEANTA